MGRNDKMDKANMKSIAFYILIFWLWLIVPLSNFMEKGHETHGELKGTFYNIYMIVAFIIGLIVLVSKDKK